MWRPIRLIRDAIQKAEISANEELDDTGVVSILSKLKKQRLDSIEAYEKGGRDDLVEREKKEIEIISEYMPRALDEKEIADLVAHAIEEALGSGMNLQERSSMGDVMKALKGKYEGRASGKDVSAQVKKQLRELQEKSGS